MFPREILAPWRRALYLYRRTLSGLWDREEEFYVASCSSKTVVYKGMVQSSALKKFYLDLANELCVSQFAIYHRTYPASLKSRRWRLHETTRPDAVFAARRGGRARVSFVCPIFDGVEATLARRRRAPRRRGDGVDGHRHPHTRAVDATRHSRHTLRPLLDEHDAPLELSTTFQADRAQRRDQHDPGQRELDGFSRALAAGADMGAVAAGCSSDDPDRSCEFVDPDQLGPVVDASKSDSANLDASLELYTRAGRTVDESLLLMMPPAIPKKEEKLFFDLHAPSRRPGTGPRPSVIGRRRRRCSTRQKWFETGAHHALQGRPRLFVE